MNRIMSLIIVGSIILPGAYALDYSVANKEEKIATEADYILSCQYTKHPQHPAYGAINNIHGDPTWVVPRENAMAILGLIVSSEALYNKSYIEKGQLAADYLIKIQDPSDGGWYEGYNFKLSPQYYLIYTSQNLSGHSVYAECNPGGETNCLCSDEDVSILPFKDYGEVISNPREINTYVNAIGYKKFTETFPDRDSIDVSIYKYTGQVKLPDSPSSDVNNTTNPQAVHMMIQLWDGRKGLWNSNNHTLEGTIYWDLNPWTPDGKNGTIMIYTKPTKLIPIANLTPDTDWHNFELVVNLTSKKYISISIDGKLVDLSTYELAQVYHGPGSPEQWGNDISLCITTESLASWPGENCENNFTWTTQFKDLELIAIHSNWNRWIDPGSKGGATITTTELQDSIHHWLEDIPVRGHIMTTADLQEIIGIWLSDFNV